MTDNKIIGAFLLIAYLKCAEREYNIKAKRRNASCSETR